MNVFARKFARALRTPLLALLLLGPAGLAARQDVRDTVPRRGAYTRHPEAVKAIDALKSPYCPGFMLEVCTSAGGAALRDSIDALADDGWPADSIVDWVLANHGEEYLALPPREGKGLVAWIVPPVVVLLGFGMVIVALRQMRKSHRPPAPVHELTAEDERKLEEALRDLEAEEDVPLL